MTLTGTLILGPDDFEASSEGNDDANKPKSPVIERFTSLAATNNPEVKLNDEPRRGVAFEIIVLSPIWIPSCFSRALYVGETHAG